MGITNFTNNKTPNDTGSSGIPMGIPGFPNDGGIDPSDFLINYNDKFKNAGVTMFRDEAIQQTLGILIGKNKPNVIFVGPAGVGKTKITEDIAYRLANDDPLIPDALKGFTIYELPLSNIVADSSFQGQLESKLISLIQFMEDPANKAILFIDEIHQIMGGTNQAYYKISQTLKPALARGNMRVIGATTTQEAKNMLDDPAFSRRFSKLIIEELTKDQTLQILCASKPSFVAHYNNCVALDDSVMCTVVDLAEQYKPAGSHRPDNALTLLDRAIGDAIVERKRQEAVLSANPTPANTQALTILRTIMQIPVTEKQIRSTAIRLATSNSKPETLDITKLKDALSCIKGQDDILAYLIKQLQKHEMNLLPSKSPLTMLFIGPSGVGKTEVTKILAQQITGCEPIVLNMTEYNDPATINRIIGSPAGYVGSDSNSELPFDCLESNPYKFILLDEFEKCDPAVKRLFMQVFEEGTLKTNRGTVVDFSKAIIIATTNAGHQATQKTLGFATGKTSSVTKTSIQDLSAYFDIALLTRFKERITFKPIPESTYREILVAKYHTALTTIRSNHNQIIVLPDDIPSDVLDKMVKDTYEPDFGARPANAAIEEYIYSQVL